METRLPTKRRIKNTGIIKHDVYNAESRAARILLPASLRDPQASKTGVREELGTTKNVRAFLVKDILSRKECEVCSLTTQFLTKLGCNCTTGRGRLAGEG